MKTRFCVLVVVLLMSALLSGNVWAQQPEHSRAGKPEFYLLVQAWSAENISLENLTLPTAPGLNPPTATSDLHFKLESTTMWGFGAGYNFSELLFLRGEMTFGSPDYEMQWNNSRITGDGWMNKGNINLDLNLMRHRPFSPFISAGLGYLYMDTGIPNGPPEYAVWWDYFWGPVLVGSQPTYTNTYLTYNAAAGVRWGINDRMALRFVFTTNWVDAKRDTLRTYEGTFAFSFRY